MSSPPNPTGLEDSTSDSATLSASLQAASLNDVEQPTQNGTEKHQADPKQTRPLRIYTRAQLLNLHRSPLVQPPPDMPELKSWFGTENEQSLVKKDTEQSTPSGSRDRRFRREYEEGETPSRPSFRSTLTQPSQMGNFKHQSLRDRDKDRDRDGDRDRERDLRDREGQERLRHLSDKYDRDRLSLTANARSKDRESATSTKTGSQTQPTANAPRKGETRDPSKRKLNESGDDWRRGGDISRNAREDRSDTARRDRSRARDSSRTRAEPSSRRERNADREDGRERTNRDRDDPRRDRDDDEETRHWRDDGKRDERVAARKARERGGDHWEPSSDRRWAATEEREGRYKRTNGRDRRGQDDGRERDDRKDREREREKEKEPAWMETYVPNEPLAGILGGVSSTGELDGIQAWKKGMKEKEKEKDEKEGGNRSLNEPPATAKAEKPSQEEAQPSQAMDEIQLFRLMMQKAKEKPEADGTAPSEPVTAQVIQGSKRADGPRAPDTTVDASNNLESKLSNAPDTPSMTGQGGLNPRLTTVETTAISITSLAEKPASDLPSQFNPPAGPRLLALGRGTNKPPLQPPNPPLITPGSHAEASQGPVGYNSFEEVAHQRVLLDRVTPNGPLLSDGLQRLPMDRSPLNAPQQFGPGILDNGQIDGNGNGYAVPRASRFAKFFDGKTRDAPPAKVQTPGSFTSPSPNHAQSQRFDQGSFSGPLNGTGESRTMDDIIAMLANSQAHRTSQNVNINPGLPSIQSNPSFNGHNNHPILHQHQLNANRTESLYDSRLDDRSFVPDGMVPGLRTAPPPRSRDSFPDPMDDPVLHIQRLAQQQQLQQRADPNFSGPANPMFTHQHNPRGIGLPLQGQPFRRGPSPNTAQQLGVPLSRGVPPGLANLGSRPPHEASQFLSLPGGPSGPQLAALTNSGQLHQQQFNNFNNANTSNLGFGNHQQFRGPVPSMNPPNAGGHLPMGNLSQNNIDPRLAAQGFGLGGLGGVPIGQRGLGNNGLPQQRLGPQLQGPHLGLRPQQQGQLPHHMLPHNMHGPGPQGPSNQPAQDLMALLMGGTLRNE